METITYGFPAYRDVEQTVYTDAYRLILHCSNTRSPKAFAETLVCQCKDICPYDHVIVFYYDTCGRLADVYKVGTQTGWLESYLDYYLEISDDRNYVFDLSSPEVIENPEKTTSRIIEWDSVRDSMFKTEYINTVGLKYTFTFEFFDMKGAPRVTFCIDRCQESPFTEKEKKTITLALPILNNIFRNFFYHETNDSETISLWKDCCLTEREKQIADMLCRGMKTPGISSLLCISEGTVRKHIAHIYGKVNVSSQTELITRVLITK